MLEKNECKSQDKPSVQNVYDKPCGNSTLEIPAFGRLRQERCCDFESGVDYKVRMCLKNKTPAHLEN